MSTSSIASIPECTAGDDPGAMHEALDAAGCLVIHDVASAEATEALRAEMSSPMDAAVVTDDSPEDFYPGNTRRAISLAYHSPTARGFIMNPDVEAMCERHLGPHCDRHQLHVTAALEIGPGAREQVLHREEDQFPFFPLPRPNLILATMWAISDFTKDNGATNLVPGSHRWEEDRSPTDDEIVAAEMPAGSVLCWLGGTLHGAGANVTVDMWRYGVILSYSLSWLRQEENQHLSIPLADVFTFPEPLIDRLGFGMDYNGTNGFYDPTVVLEAR